MKVLGICAGRINGNTEIMMKEAFTVKETKTFWCLRMTRGRGML